MAEDAIDVELPVLASESQRLKRFALHPLKSAQTAEARNTPVKDGIVVRFI